MIAEIFLSLVLVYFVRHVISTYLTRKNMPPGPFPFPVVGNIPHLLCDPVSPFSKLADKYGDIFTVTFPSGNVVVLNSASLVREGRLGKHEILSGKLPRSAYPHSEIFGRGLLTADYSAQMRFRRQVFKSALHIFGAGVEKASLRATHAVDTAIEEIDSKVGQPFSPRELLESSILVQLWEWLTTKKVALNDPTIKYISEFGEISSKLALFSNVYEVIPFMTYLPTQFNSDIKRAQQIRDMIFPPEYHAHKKTYIPGVVRDLTDSFISCYEKEIAKETTKDIGSMEDIPFLMLDVAMGGSDTTSKSLAWFILYMVLHPDVQEKIHKELDVIAGNDRLPSWKDAQNMPYLQATLCEVQRASGMVGVVGTNALRDVTISDYHIPKETFVALNLAKLHHDEREWPEPEKFKPERFLDSDGSFVGWNKLHGFIPFGIGRRECAGQPMAKIMLFTFASILLHRYKIELPEGEEIPTTEVSKPALTKGPEDFKVLAKKRNALAK